MKMNLGNVEVRVELRKKKIIQKLSAAERAFKKRKEHLNTMKRIRSESTQTTSLARKKRRYIITPEQEGSHEGASGKAKSTHDVF